MVMVPNSPPGHGLTGEELQLVVVQTETCEREQTSEGLGVQVVQRVVTETKPFDVLQALEGEDVACLTNVPTPGDFSAVLSKPSLQSFLQVVLPERPCWGCRPVGCV